MEYNYILTDGTTGPLYKIFLDNSQVIKNMLSSCEECNEIPILKEGITRLDVENTTLLLYYLNEKSDVTKEKIDEVVNERNLHFVEGMIKLSEYCDIEITLNYLLKFVAELIRKTGSIEELKNLFSSNYKKLKYFGRGCLKIYNMQSYRRHRENLVAAAGLPCQDRIDIRCGCVLGLLLSGNFIQHEIESMGRRLNFMVNSEEDRDIFWTDFSHYVMNLRHNNPFNTFISDYDDYYLENFKANQFMMIVDALESFLVDSLEWKGKVIIEYYALD